MPPSKDTISPKDKRRLPGRRRGDGSERSHSDRDGRTLGGVTFRVRRLEPLVAWVLAGFTLWLNIVSTATAMSFWLIAFFAACIGGWGRMFPARQQAVMFARAALLLAGAVLLQVTAGVGGATGLYAFLPALTLVFYTLVLAVPWAIALLVLTLLAFAMVCWLTLPVVPWPVVLAYTGFLLCVAPLSMQFGKALRQSDESTESSMRDDRTQLYNETGFFVHGAVLLAECRQRGRPFCMVLLNGADLLDVRGLLGRKVANDLFAQVVRGIAGVSGEGIAARTDAVEFALLLPGVTADRAAALVKQQLGDPPKVEVKVGAKGKADAKPIVIVLDIAIGQAKDKAQAIEDLYDSLHVTWAAPKESGKTVAKVPVLGPDDDRVSAPRRASSPTVPMDLRPKDRPWDK